MPWMSSDELINQYIRWVIIQMISLQLPVDREMYNCWKWQSEMYTIEGRNRYRWDLM